MCWQVLPYALSAVGAAGQRKAQNDLVDDQRRIAAEGVLRQAAVNREADQRVAQTTQQIAASNPAAEQAAKRATYLDALRKSLPAREGAVPASGAVSSRFAQDADTARAQTEAEAVQNADLTAAIEAPQYQRQKEGVALNNATVDLNALRSRSASQDFLTRLRLAMTKPNQWLTAAGQLASGAGAAMAGNVGLEDPNAVDAFGVPTDSAKKYGRARGVRTPATPMGGVNG
jgi:hypothetical protein